jgi:uroporphyrinogen decarboxylase
LYEIPDFKYRPLGQMTWVEEINNYPWPDLGEDYRYIEAASKTREYQNRGYDVCGEMYQAIRHAYLQKPGLMSFALAMIL